MCKEKKGKEKIFTNLLLMSGRLYPCQTPYSLQTALLPQQTSQCSDLSNSGMALLMLFLLAMMLFPLFRFTASSFWSFQISFKCYLLREFLLYCPIWSTFPSKLFSILALFGFLHSTYNICHYFLCYFTCVFICFPNSMQALCRSGCCLSGSSFYF